MATRIQVRRGTTSEWNTANPTLEEGEIGYNSTLGQIKIGDGSTSWGNLDYVVNSTALDTSLGSYIPDSEKSAINGVAELDASKNILAPAGIIFEGTANDHETTLAITDPTADRTITFPDATGTVALTSDIAELSQDAIDSALTAGTGITKSYNDGANTLTLSVDTTTIQTRVTDVSDTEIGYLNGVTSAIQTQIDGKSATGHGHTAANISDFDTQVRTSKVTDLAAPTSSFSMNSQKITSLATPTSDADAATKAYVDAATAGLNVHAAVQAATTANITLASALENGDTLDGVTLATGNRVLVKNQTDKTENGIYVVKTSGAPDRADDYNTAGEIDAGDFIFVESGTANGKTGYVQTNVITTVGSDNIEFTQFSGAGTYSAGTGLTLTGTTFSANIGSDIQAYNSTLAAVAGGTYTGDDSITTLGTISAGTWNGTTIAIANGGTGQTTAMAAATALLPSQTSNSGKYLTNDGSGTLSWATVSGYSAPTLGSTSIASGATVTTIAGLTLSSPTITGSLTAGGGTGSSGQVLSSTGSGVQWSTPAAGAAFSEFMLIGA